MILYFNHQYLDHPEIQPLLQNINGNVFDKLLNFRVHDPAIASFYNRKGINFLPTESNIDNLPGFSMPDYDPKYNKSWSDICDQTCRDLRATHFDRPWMVMWSGGIDSTSIVSSIIKNLPQSDFENITVACSATSIWENPRFYRNYIQPNFKTVTSEWALSQDALERTNWIIDGEPADQLFGGLGVAPELVFQQPEVLKKNIIMYPETVINWIARKTDKKFAEWFYTAIVNNAASVGIPMISLHDWIWWAAFNHAWISIKLRLLFAGSLKNIKNTKLYFDRIVHWYDSTDYQSWAMSNQSTGEKINQSVGEYKLAAKKYIYELNRDNYYYQFKTKTSSNDIWGRNQKRAPWCCIDNNGNLLNWHEHKDLIARLLPYHFIQKGELL